MPGGFTRERARATLVEWTASASLVKHGLAVACCTEAYGVREALRLGLGEAEVAAMAETYACAGLLHDFDYDRHPTTEEHPYVGVAHLREVGLKRFSTQSWPTPITPEHRGRRIWIKHSSRAMNLQVSLLPARWLSQRNPFWL